MGGGGHERPMRPNAPASFAWRTVCCLLVGALAACTGGGPSRDGRPAARAGGNNPQGTSSPVPQGVSRDPLVAACALPPEWLARLRRGYVPGRSPDVVVVPQRPNFYASVRSGELNTTTHSGVWSYLQRVPLVFYGPGIIEAKGDVRVPGGATVADIAATQAALLGHELPGGRTGGALDQAFSEERRPELVVTVVWDGGGWNVLDRWRGSWPYLRQLMRRGVSVTNATVGSSPSVTPAVHATLGTGAFPRDHGLVDADMRLKGRIVDPWQGDTPERLSLRTLSDAYDLATGNHALIAMVAFRAWHLGMIGHGSYIPGADKDIAVMFQGDSGLITIPQWYSLPAYLGDVPGWRRDARDVDAADGRQDLSWRDHDVLAERRHIMESPAWLLYQTRLLKALLQREGFGDDNIPDLAFTNYKQIDLLGHRYNMLSEEVGDAVRFSDLALKRLVGDLDRIAGRGDWVLILTADHGQQPAARAVGAWPISASEIDGDISARFGTDGADLVQASRPSGVWLDRAALERADVTLEDVARFLLTYTTGDNAANPDDLSAFGLRGDERIFQAAFPGARMGKAWRCSRSRDR